MAVRAAPAKMKDTSLIVRRLGDVGGGFYASPSYLARRGKPKQLGENKHEWVVHPAMLTYWKLPRGRSWRFLCDDLLVIRDLLREGAGVGFLPAFVAAPYVRDGFLEGLHLVDGPRESGALVLVYPSSGQVPRKVTAFRDFLLERLKLSSHA